MSSSCLADGDIWTGSIQDAYSCVHAFLGDNHVHGDVRFVQALAIFASACNDLRGAMIIEDPTSLRTRLGVLLKAHHAVEQGLWSSYADLNMEASKTTFHWSRLKDTRIDPLAKLLDQTEPLAHWDLSNGVYLVANLHQESKDVFSCADRNSLGQRGFCSLCYIQDQPGWEASAENPIGAPCHIFITCPRVRDGLLCGSRDIERTFMAITRLESPSRRKARRHSRTLRLRIPSLAALSLDCRYGIKADILGALDGLPSNQHTSVLFASVRGLVWIICGYSIESIKTAKLMDTLFLHVRVEGLEAYLATAIGTLASADYSGPLPNKISLDRFHRRLVHLVREWYCVYGNATDRSFRNIEDLIDREIFKKWPRLRNGFVKSIAPMTEGDCAPGSGLRTFLRHKRRTTGSTGYDDTLLDKFDEGYAKRVRDNIPHATTFMYHRALKLPSKVRLNKGYSGLSHSSIISNIVGEGIRAFATQPEQIAWSISCIQARLYGRIDFESVVIHMCQHAKFGWPVPRMFCEACKAGVDDDFMRERQFTEAIPLWVYDSIISPKTPARRMETALMWIKVANALMEIRNWSGLRMVTHALVFLLSNHAHKHIPLPDVSIRAMRRLHMLVFEKAPGKAQSHIDRLEHTIFTDAEGQGELSLPYLGRFHETILNLAPTDARTCRSGSSGEMGFHCTAMRLSTYEEIVQLIDWHEGVNIDYVYTRELRGLDLAEEIYQRRKNEPGVGLHGCQEEQTALDRTLEGYVRQQLEDILERYPCPAQGRENIAAQSLPHPYFLQGDVEEERKDGDVTIGHLLAAIHTYDGDVVAEAKKDEEEFLAHIRCQFPSTPNKPASLWRRLSERIPRGVEIVWD